MGWPYMVTKNSFGLEVPASTAEVVVVATRAIPAKNVEIHFAQLIGETANARNRDALSVARDVLRFRHGAFAHARIAPAQ